jgi:archaemetzincin
MNLIKLVTVGEFDRALAEQLAPRLEREFGAYCEFASACLDPQPAFHPERQQYHSTELLADLQLFVNGGWRVLGLASMDLYIPILTFVFGEAQMPGPCAIISTHRLRQECYGFPADSRLLFERTLKEAVHELGHTVGLTHCDNFDCAMAPSHSVEWVDLKTASFCDVCRSLLTGETTRRAI